MNEFIGTITEVVDGIIQRQSSSHGGFYDIPEMNGARGGLQRRNKSILENAVIAEALVRFHYLTFTEEYVQVAEKCLAAFAKDYQLYGYFTAGYARAVDLFYNKPLYVVIVGPGGDHQTLTLAEEASKHYLASRIILTIDPETEKELASSMEFPLDRDPTAYVCMEKTCHAAIKDARELRAALMKVDSNRNYRR